MIVSRYTYQPAYMIIVHTFEPNDFFATLYFNGEFRHRDNWTAEEQRICCEAVKKVINANPRGYGLTPITPQALIFDWNE